MGNLKTLKNGAIYDLDAGRIVNSKNVTNKITAENSADLSRRRKEQYRRAAIKRIVGEASSIDPSVSTGADAFGLVASKQFTALMDSDKPKIDDLQKLGNIMTGAEAQNSRRENAAPPAGAIVAPPAALVELVGLLEQKQRLAVDAARAVDTDIRNENNGSE